MEIKNKLKRYIINILIIGMVMCNNNLNAKEFTFEEIIDIANIPYLNKKR